MKDFVLNSFNVPNFFGEPLLINPLDNIVEWIDKFFTMYIDEYINECKEEHDDYDKQVRKRSMQRV